MTIEFFIPGKPQAKQRPKVTMVGGYAKAYTPKQTIEYENHVKGCFIHKFSEDSNASKLYELPLKMSVTVYYSIPKTFSKVKQEKALTAEIVPTTRPDIDNIAKSICDALNGIAFKDDSQIVDLNIIKRYSRSTGAVVAISDYKI